MDISDVVRIEDATFVYNDGAILVNYPPFGDHFAFCNTEAKFVYLLTLIYIHLACS